MLPSNKADLRSRLRAARSGLASSTRQRAGSQLAKTVLDWLSTSSMPSTPPTSDGGCGTSVGGPKGVKTICAYLSVGSEPPTDELLVALCSAGHTVFVPVCEPGFQLAWVRWFPGVDLVKSQLAPVMEAVGQHYSFAELGPVQAVLVPALAVDSSGTRLGQGGGYYDRFLAGIFLGGIFLGGSGQARVAAVVYDQEFLTAGDLPHDSLDMPVGYIVTPSGVSTAAGI